MEGGEAEAGRRKRARLLEPGLSCETAGTENRKETAAPPGFRSNDENCSHHTAHTTVSQNKTAADAQLTLSHLSIVFASLSRGVNYWIGVKILWQRLYLAAAKQLSK